MAGEELLEDLFAPHEQRRLEAIWQSMDNFPIPPGDIYHGERPRRREQRLAESRQRLSSRGARSTVVKPG